MQIHAQSMTQQTQKDEIAFHSFYLKMFFEVMFMLFLTKVWVNELGDNLLVNQEI